jgi:DNA-binding beta-propeller fold protein YncE
MWVFAAVFGPIALSALFAAGAAAKGGGQVGEGFGSAGVGNGQFFNPALLGVDSADGTLYTGDLVGGATAEISEATNYRIQQLTASGEFKASAEIKRVPETGKIASLHGIAVDHSLGRIYLIEGCRVASAGGSLSCLKTGGKIGARNVLVYSTTPEGTQLVPDESLPKIALPSGENEIYEPQAIAVDPANHDIVVLAAENEKHRIVQRISSAGVLGARYTDKADQLKPASGGSASSLAVSPTGAAYTMTGNSTPPASFTRLFKLPQSLASLEEVASVSAAASREEWVLGLESKVDSLFGGPQLAISTDGSTLYWKEWRKKSEESVAGELAVRAYSLSKGETLGYWGGGSSRCAITTSPAPLAAGPAGSLRVFDTGAPTKKPTQTPAYGLKLLTFGASGSGCAEPVARFTVDGVAEGADPAGIGPGESVVFDATSSALTGSARGELIWDFGDGSEEIVTPAHEGEQASAEVEHAYAGAGKYTVRLELKLQTPTFGNPDPVQRTFTVGAVVVKQKLKVTMLGSGSGTVASSPAGIDCGVSCEALYPQGTEVTLTALPDPGSHFAGWEGAPCLDATCVVAVGEPMTIAARFDRDVQPPGESEPPGEGVPPGEAEPPGEVVPPAGEGVPPGEERHNNSVAARARYRKAVHRCRKLKRRAQRARCVKRAKARLKRSLRS